MSKNDERAYIQPISESINPVKLFEDFDDEDVKREGEADLDTINGEIEIGDGGEAVLNDDNSGMEGGDLAGDDVSDDDDAPEMEDDWNKEEVDKNAIDTDAEPKIPTRAAKKSSNIASKLAEANSAIQDLLTQYKDHQIDIATYKQLAEPHLKMRRQLEDQMEAMLTGEKAGAGEDEFGLDF